MVLYAKSDKGFRREHAWAIAIPAAATLLLYALVHIEWRFVAAQVAILFLCVFSSIVFSDADQSRRLARNTVVVVVSVSALIAAFVVFGSFMTSIGPVYADAAAALSQDGVRPGDRIALVWNEKWNAGAAEGAFVPRLLRLNIVAEETGADAFWKLPQATRNGILDELRQNGIRAILAFDVPANTRSGWQQLGSTDYFGFIFPPK
jgi:hypothetical protein